MSFFSGEKEMEKIESFAQEKQIECNPYSQCQQLNGPIQALNAVINVYLRVL